MPVYTVNNNQSNKKSKTPKGKIIGIVLLVFSIIGYMALITNFLSFFKIFVIGTFGIFSYILFLLMSIVGSAMISGRKYTMRPRYAIYLLVCLICILCLFTIAFNGMGQNLTFGAYLSSLYNSQLSIGGVLIGIPVYLVGAVLSSIVLCIAFFVTLLVIFVCLIIDFLNKQKEGYVYKSKPKGHSKGYLAYQNYIDNNGDGSDTKNEMIKSPNKSKQNELFLSSVVEIPKQKNQNISDIKNSHFGEEKVVNKQLELFTANYKTSTNKEIFSLENKPDDMEVDFNSSPFNPQVTVKKTYKDEKNRQKNLDFLQATINPKGFETKKTTEDYAATKKYNSNIDDNIKNLPIQELLKSVGIQSSNPQPAKLKKENNEKSGQLNEQGIESVQAVEVDNSKLGTYEFINTINKDTLLNNMIKPVKHEKPVEKTRFEQTSLMNGKKEVQKAKYIKPSRYIAPPIDLLNTISTDQEDYGAEYEKNIEKIETLLANFHIPAVVKNTVRGPAVTRYELEMPAGISVNKIFNYANDIAMVVKSSYGVRIEAPIPGKNAVGIEVPNDKIATVGFKDVISSKEFYNAKSNLTFAVGKDIAGDMIVCDLAKLPHVLIAGSTGSGKSVCLNSLIMSILFKASPDDVRFILIDPKRVEFNMYNGLPHMILPQVINDSYKAVNAFNWAIEEMESRYELFQENTVRDLNEYNSLEEVQRGDLPKKPKIIIVVDELADLFSVAKKELEEKIMRLSQKARAAGIHLVLATQRPSVDIITGTIKTNLPSRIAFRLTSFVDSKTILDQAGAEKLLGKGDMLYFPQGYPEPKRIQGAFVSNEEVKAVIEFIKQNNSGYFDPEVTDIINKEKPAQNQNSTNVGSSEYERDENAVDPLLPQALKYCVEVGQASSSSLQRRFSIGFSRAGRIVDQMERLKYVSMRDGARPRSVYLTMEEYNEIYGEE